MALFGSIASLESQVPRTPGFAAAFAYIASAFRGGSPERSRLESLAAGESKRVELGGGVFAIEQAYAAKPRSEGFFESHRAYIDVQAVIEGCESIEVIDASRAAVREAYDKARDLALHVEAPHASRLCLCAGEAAVFFPVDVHMPSLQVDSGAGLVRKTVVKIPVG